MRAAVFKGPGSIEVTERPDPIIEQPTDAVVRVVLACVCGSDLWYWRGETSHAVGSIGHEFIGVVEAVGAEVRGVGVGDFVIAPFIFSDMSCPHCLNGATLSCLQGGNFGSGEIDGGQGERVRVPLAGTTLVPVPGSGHSDEMLKSLLTLSDVMATGHHAAVSAGVTPGATVAVVGDGAVGLCAILASQRIGAARIIALSGHPERQKLALGSAPPISSRSEATRLPRPSSSSPPVWVPTPPSSASAPLSRSPPPAPSPGPDLPSASWEYPTERFLSSTPSFATSGGAVDPLRLGSTSQTSLPTCSRGRSTQVRSLIMRLTSRTSPRPTRPWTSGVPSSP